jgi:DNA-binding FadR family transcriptional regulator
MMANDLFHDLIYRAASNPMLAQVGGDLRDAVRRFNTLPLAAADRISDVIAEHGAIVAALEAGDPDAAEWASRRHLSSAYHHYVRMQIQAPADDEDL